MERCDEDQLCTSLECGPNQDMQDGTVINGYCAYWYHGLCESEEEFSLNPANLIWTCKKIQTGISVFLAVIY